MSFDQDLIGNYFDMEDGGAFLETHRMLMQAIEGGIGFYEAWKRAAGWRTFI